MAKMPDLTPGNANSFSDTLFVKTLSNSAAVRELDEKTERTEQQIGKLEEAKTGTTDAKAVVTIVANEAGSAQLRLTYREPNATHSEILRRPSSLRCGPRRRLVSTLRFACIFARRETIHVCLLILPGEPRSGHGRRLEGRKAGSQHIRDGCSQRRHPRIRRPRR